MQDGDIDWSVYHALLDGKAGTMQDLAGMGYDPRLIEESVRRLERYYLVERSGDSLRILSFQESLLLCQAKNDETCPFVVENGVIRTRPDQGKDP
ncbi:MAG: MarR family transcriptional regulator [Methanomicrobiales archaeon]|nr:MarR family transcriptional regulator [Methanomicrobiales archaeon]